MLAALVWSLYLLSDQMTNAAYASGLGDTAPSLIAGASEPQDPDTAFSLLAEMLQETRNAENGSSTGPADRELELGQATAGPRAIQAPMSSATGPVVSSLSAIAVALGFWHPTESMAALLAETADVKAVTAARTLQQVQVIVADTPRAEHAHDDHAPQAMTATETAEQIHAWSHAALAPNAINLVYDLAGVTVDILSKLTAGMNQSLGLKPCSSSSAARFWVMGATVVPLPSVPRPPINARMRHGASRTAGQGPKAAMKGSSISASPPASSCRPCARSPAR